MGAQLSSKQENNKDKEAFNKREETKTEKTKASLDPALEPDG